MVRIAAVSLKRINSMPILAAARIPVQMKFLVGTLTGIRDIDGATGLEDFLRTIALFAVLGMNAEQDVPVLDLSFVAFRLILRNTHANERTGKASGYVRL